VLNDRPFNPSNVVSDGKYLSPAHLMYGRLLNTLHYNEVINMTRNSPLTRTHPPFLVTVLAYGYLGHSLLFLLSLFHALYLGFVK
jgi:hypothetical protein